MGKEKNKQKVERLVCKYANRNSRDIEDGKIRNVSVTDEKLGQLDERIEKTLKVFGDVSINEKEKGIETML